MTLLGPMLMIALIVDPGAAREPRRDGREDRDRRRRPACSRAARRRVRSATHRALDRPTVVPPDTTDERAARKIRDKRDQRLPRGSRRTRSTAARSSTRATTRRNQMVDASRSSSGHRRGRDRAARRGIAELTDEQLATCSARRRDRDAAHHRRDRRATSGIGDVLLGYILAFILYMVITLYGVNVMRSVVTEKTSRVIELMVAAVKPRATDGRQDPRRRRRRRSIQIAVWLVDGRDRARVSSDAILGAFGVALRGGAALPSLGRRSRSRSIARVLRARLLLLRVAVRRGRRDGVVASRNRSRRRCR